MRFGFCDFCDTTTLPSIGSDDTLERDDCMAGLKDCRTQNSRIDSTPAFDITIDDNPIKDDQRKSRLLTTLQEVAKKRSRRTVKSQRAIVGASLDVIKERRAMRPEARAAQRAANLTEIKSKKAEAEKIKKAEKAKKASAAAKGQAQRSIQSKQGSKGAQMRVAANTR